MKLMLANTQLAYDVATTLGFGCILVKKDVVFSMSVFLPGINAGTTL